MIRPITIGNVRIENNIFLAPVAGVTDYSFRRICRGQEQSCGLTYSEMVSAKSIVYNNAQTLQLLDNADRPWAVQIFGSEAEVMAEAARRLEEICEFDILDVNMGCPAPKIVKNGEGCALMNEPAKAAAIIESLARASSKPVTVKIRKGFHSENAVEIAKIAQESGAAAIAVHGRTRDRFYSGEADWDCIAQVKAAVRIPVIGNGDVVSAESAERMFAQTGCDAIMIARGALGNPWIFAQILGTRSEIPLNERIETALKHARMVISHKGERVGTQEMRKHLCWYIKGLPSAARLRVLINKVCSYSEIETLLREGLHFHSGYCPAEK